MSKWDKEVDILVVGSGAGGLLSGLVAAHNHADVLIIEKENLWGGTSATSGAGIWIPASDQAKAEGFDDRPEDAFKYVRALSADNVPDANISAYVAAKHGVLGLVRSVAHEVARKGITCNAVCPGFVDTDMATTAREGVQARLGITAEEAEAMLVASNPVGRLISVDEVVDAVLYLAGENAAMVNGHALSLSGGEI